MKCSLCDNEGTEVFCVEHARELLQAKFAWDNIEGLRNEVELLRRELVYLLMNQKMYAEVLVKIWDKLEEGKKTTESESS